MPAHVSPAALVLALPDPCVAHEPHAPHPLCTATHLSPAAIVLSLPDPLATPAPAGRPPRTPAGV
jgi:phage tail protein X